MRLIALWTGLVLLLAACGGDSGQPAQGGIGAAATGEKPTFETPPTPGRKL